MEQVLVEEYRNETLECLHRGHICGVGPDGQVKYEVGDADFVAFLRSAGKPFQAIPGVRAGIKEAYELTDQEIAIMTASHRGESFHLETLSHLMDHTGLEQSNLVCAESYPMHRGSREQIIRNQGHEQRVYHNCSGKHFGVLSYCKLMGYPLEGYEDPGHPVQQEIVETLSMMAELPADQIARGTDGCGLPVFALPLKHIARAYLKLSCPELIEDEKTREAVQKITAAMHAHPEMVSGTNRICTTLMEDTNIIAKGGFKGIYGFSLRQEQLGFAFKIVDGSDEEWAHIVVSILEQIGYANQQTIHRIRERFPSAIRNDAGKIVGHTKEVFHL
ncbi:asparaginase [Paenibacillus selenitireducens]|uniref:Asparaginase n=1 Tax=Paenibacillus selenitireducens TaxID=1324314 RepID=A0A1T2X383_9BACL|nr:asparaginase [Paenibacillus selenitireducens]OPA74312.1 asparaginase [Paenibacillus selenitireducens]